MKKLLFFAAALFAAASFSACSDDDNVNMDLLYGTWREVYSYGYAMEDGKKVDEWNVVYEVDEGGLYTLHKNGMGRYHNSSVDWDIRYTQNGNTLQLICTDTQYDETYSYTWTIELLTETRLVGTQYSKYDLENGNVYEEFDTITLERVK